MTVHDLPTRQLRIAQLVAEGLTDKQIAAQIVPTLSTRQVRREIDAIVHTLQLDRSKSVRILITRRVLDVDNAA